MRECGKVKKVEDNVAVVHLDSPDPSCGGCCGCAPAPSGGRDIELKAVEGLKKGDNVAVEIPKRSSVWSTVMLFVIPMILLIGGVVTGYAVSPESGADGKVNLGALILGVGLMLGWYGLVCVIEKFLMAPLPPPHIVEIISEEEAMRLQASACAAHNH